MKWMGLYLAGYALIVIGIVAALWKTGALERIGTFWTAIGLVVAVGIGIILAVSGSGQKSMIEVDRN
jgi:hypothetical protein